MSLEWTNTEYYMSMVFSSNLFLFLAHLSTTCSGWAIMIALCPASIVRRATCVMRLPQFTSNDISSVTTGRISTKVDRIVTLEVFYQTCSNSSAPLNKMATKAKNRKTTSPPRLVAQFQNNFTKMFLRWLSTKNSSTPLNKMAARAKSIKTFKRHLLLGQMPDFKIISQKCFFGDPLPKLLKWFRSAEQNGRQS